MSFQQALTAQHRACDDGLAGIEQAAHRTDWAAAAAAAAEFIAATEGHFDYEEQTLFPALEAALPAAAGPTSVMRSEHSQMRELLGELRAAIRAGDAQALGDAVEILLFLMQQHNAKEESVLYPMADRILPPDHPAANAAGAEGGPWNN